MHSGMREIECEGGEAFKNIQFCGNEERKSNKNLFIFIFALVREQLGAAINNFLAFSTHSSFQTFRYHENKAMKKM